MNSRRRAYDHGWAHAERLGREERGGFLRLGLAHCNTAAEEDRTLAALNEL